VRASVTSLPPNGPRATHSAPAGSAGTGVAGYGTLIDTKPDPLTVLRASLRERLAALRGVPEDALPPALLDVTVQRVRVPGGDVFLVRPADWEQLRHEEGGAGRPAPYWATPWPSGGVLAGALAEAPPPPGARVLELGCGLGLPSIVAARSGADVLATDGSSDAVAFAAHSLALNELDGEVAQVDWSAQADALAARGPWDLVLGADVLYLRDGAAAALALLPRLLAPGGEVRLADPRRAGARDFLAAARASFTVRTTQDGDVALHRLTRRVRAGGC
jgi:predicted nicotinamide N-methyase